MNYKIIRFIKSFNPRELFNLLYVFKTIILKPLSVITLPFFLNIESTTRCNLRCDFCSNQKYPDEKKVDLSLEQFKLILSQFPAVKSICLGGIGEPLLNKDLFRMVRLAKECRIYTGFVSNGILLDEQASQEILDSKLDWISFSLDTVHKAKYEEIRKGGSFDRLIHNIKYLISLKKKSLFHKKNYIPDISFNFIAMKGTIEELPKIIELAHVLKVKKVSVDRVTFLGKTNNGHDKFIPDISQKSAKLIKIKSTIKARKLGINLLFRNFYYPEIAPKSCCVPWIASFIDSQGYVTPCCILNNSNLINFGNIFKENFINIWNNKAYQNFRRQFKGNKLPTVCEGCAFHRDIYTNINIKFFDFLHNCGRILTVFSKK